MALQDVFGSNLEGFEPEDCGLCRIIDELASDLPMRMAQSHLRQLLRRKSYKLHDPAIEERPSTTNAI